MFEDEKTEEYWKELAEEKGRELKVDTREGSVYMDTQAGHCMRTAKFYNDLDSVSDMLSIDTCFGEILEEKAQMEGLERIPAISARYSAQFEGTIPDDGSEFFCSNLYFIWNKNGSYLESEESGEKANYIEEGNNLIPMDNIEGLVSAKIGKRILPGADEETDDSLRERLREKKTGKPDNGNKHNYKTWCESIQGVGKAVIYPLWAGENTVRGVLFSTDGTSASDEIVSEVQQYIDPIEYGFLVEKDGKEYTFGDGVGEGQGNIGAHFLSQAAKKVEVRITADIETKSGYTVEELKIAVKEKTREYIKEIILSDKETSIKIGSIGTIIYNTDGVNDCFYSTLMINGKSETFKFETDEAPYVSEVVLNVV